MSNIDTFSSTTSFCWSSLLEGFVLSLASRLDYARKDKRRANCSLKHAQWNNRNKRRASPPSAPPTLIPASDWPCELLSHSRGVGTGSGSWRRKGSCLQSHSDLLFPALGLDLCLAEQSRGEAPEVARGALVGAALLGPKRRRQARRQPNMLLTRVLHRNNIWEHSH